MTREEKYKVAYDLKLSGLSFYEISKKLGISDTSARKYVAMYERKIDRAFAELNAIKAERKRLYDQIRSLENELSIMAESMPDQLRVEITHLKARIKHLSTVSLNDIAETARACDASSMAAMTQDVYERVQADILEAARMRRGS